MLGFGRFGRMRRRMRQSLAAVGAALLFGFQLFSAAYIAHEADHDCDGEDCQVCVELRHCVANLQSAGTGIQEDATAASLPVDAAPPASPPEVALPGRTLVALKIQLNE